MKDVKWFKWFALGLGGILGISHIGLIGVATRKASVPIISPPVGPYTSYVISADKEGYKLSYTANDCDKLEYSTKSPNVHGAIKEFKISSNLSSGSCFGKKA